MNSVESSDKKKRIKRSAMLLSMIWSMLLLAACAKSLAPDPVQGAVDVGTEKDSTKALAEAGPAKAALCGAFIEKDSRDEENGHETDEGASEETTVSLLKMKIDGQELPVIWEDNESVHALRELVYWEPMTVEMSMYGGFEQVGSLGNSLPREDWQTVTQAGDIVLYAGKQIVVFYGPNSWAYTRLGHIDLPKQEVIDLLSNGDVTLSLE